MEEVKRGWLGFIGLKGWCCSNRWTWLKGWCCRGRWRWLRGFGFGWGGRGLGFKGRMKYYDREAIKHGEGGEG
jgi:hypothetical protein